MIRLGANLFQMRHFHDHDLLISRLKLLVVMAKTYLENLELGFWQAQSMRRNADDLACFLPSWNQHLSHVNTECRRSGSIQLDHIFYQRVKLLMIMVKSIALGNPMGIHRRVALQSNLDYVCETLDHMHVFQRPSLQVVK